MGIKKEQNIASKLQIDNRMNMSLVSNKLISRHQKKKKQVLKYMTKVSVGHSNIISQ